MRPQWQKIEEWFNGRTTRERLYVSATVLLVVLFLGWQLLLSPLLKASQAQRNATVALQSRQTSLQGQIRQLQAALRNNPNQRLRQQKGQLEAERRALQAQLHRDVQTLVTPGGMVPLLRHMLASRKGLQLDSVRHLAPRRISLKKQASGQTTPKRGQAQVDAKAVPDGPQLYAHDVELVVTGTYFQLLDYLKALEGLDQRFGWRMLQYKVTRYPHAQMRLKLETLSLSKEWIGA